MRKFHIPTKEEVAEHDRKIFFELEKSIGFIPNLYAFMAHSDTALKSFLTFSSTPTVFTHQETEIIHLITSQINNCQYCLSGHTFLAKKTGLTDEQIIEIRKGNVSFNQKWNTLARMTCEIVNRRGDATPETVTHFYEAGYTDSHLVDLVMLIAQTTATNYINTLSRIPVDFPEVPVLICKCDCGK